MLQKIIAKSILVLFILNTANITAVLACEVLLLLQLFGLYLFSLTFVCVSIIVAKGQWLRQWPVIQ